MLTKTILTLAAAGSLVAAAANLVPTAPKQTTVSAAYVGHGGYKPLYIKGKPLEGCNAEPVECGLVVW